ncbi:hypothetical protein ABZV29_41550 [Streptomyces sp. NPDC005236]|uniref:hypothetical protein n=1 Tax=Streptomyces sp. NPDC005236 TaxID=3157028 RepID=UPI0033A0782B
MYLTCLSVCGFRSLAQVGNIPVSSPTILADRNDGGKSAVLTALVFLLGGHQLTDEDRTYVQTEGGVGGRWSQTWVEGVFTLDAGEVDVLGRAGSYHVLSDGSIWRASASVSVNSPDDRASCTALVDFLHTALDGSSPLFGRLEWDNSDEFTNLDALLRRRKRTSLREGRRFLRGYAWVTACPAELAAQLGGAGGLGRVPPGSPVLGGGLR